MLSAPSTPKKNFSDYCSVPTDFTDRGWSKEWGIPRFVSLFKILGVPWKINLSAGGFQTDLEVKSKTDYKKLMVWSWASGFSTKLNTPNNILISCLAILLFRCCLKEDNSQAPSEEKGLCSVPVADTRNNYTRMDGNGKKTAMISFSALETMGQKMSSVEVFARDLVPLL